MIKLTITIDEMTDRERKLDILINKQSTIDKLLDVLYPPTSRIESKGYITLVNFLYGGK